MHTAENHFDFIIKKNNIRIMRPDDIVCLFVFVLRSITIVFLPVHCTLDVDVSQQAEHPVTVAAGVGMPLSSQHDRVRETFPCRATTSFRFV